MLAPAVLAPVMPARQKHQRNERQYHCYTGDSSSIEWEHIHLLSLPAFSETFHSQVAYLTAMKRRGRTPKNARRAAATSS